MPRKQAKVHPIAADNTVLPSFTFVLLLLMLASIVLLGFLGDDQSEGVQAKEPTPVAPATVPDSPREAK